MQRFRWLIAGTLALGIVAAACGSDGGTDTAANTEPALTGNLFISGSSTVEPISALVAELFNEENPGVAISVEGPGTGDGFELFCNGETDMSDASRPIEQEEIDACAKSGIEFTELEVALDGISVLTHPSNEAVTCLNNADLYALLGPESEGFENWSDANQLGQEVGGSAAPYPNASLDVTAPGEESGTYDAFIELTGLEDIGIEQGLSEDDAATTRPDYQASGNDNVIIEGIAGSESSLGWVGYAFFEQNQDVVKAIEVDGGDGCVAPTFESIADGSYPLSRSLYIYVNNAKAAEKPELQAFVDYYVSDTGILSAVEQVGYVPLPSDRIEATRGTWESAAI
ncbi:MAG: phosphate ABC transporter substrate-binding protein PstS family protein [Actinomycetota bacterium]